MSGPASRRLLTAHNQAGTHAPVQLPQSGASVFPRVSGWCERALLGPGGLGAAGRPAVLQAIPRSGGPFAAARPSAGPRARGPAAGRHANRRGRPRGVQGELQLLPPPCRTEVDNRVKHGFPGPQPGRTLPPSLPQAVKPSERSKRKLPGRELRRSPHQRAVQLHPPAPRPGWATHLCSEADQTRVGRPGPWLLGVRVEAEGVDRTKFDIERASVRASTRWHARRRSSSGVIKGMSSPPRPCGTEKRAVNAHGLCTAPAQAACTLRTRSRQRIPQKNSQPRDQEGGGGLWCRWRDVARPAPRSTACSRFAVPGRGLFARTGQTRSRVRPSRRVGGADSAAAMPHSRSPPSPALSQPARSGLSIFLPLVARRLRCDERSVFCTAVRASCTAAGCARLSAEHAAVLDASAH